MKCIYICKTKQSLTSSAELGVVSAEKVIHYTLYITSTSIYAIFSSRPYSGIPRHKAAHQSTGSLFIATTAAVARIHPINPPAASGTKHFGTDRSVVHASAGVAAIDGEFFFSLRTEGVDGEAQRHQSQGDDQKCFHFGSFLLFYVPNNAKRK